MIIDRIDPVARRVPVTRSRDAASTPAALASLHLIAATARPAYFAAVEAEDAMDPDGIGLTRWQASLEVPTGAGLGFDPDPAFLVRYAMS